MKVLFVSAEVTPFAKVGGLADVAGSLPKAMRQLGVDIRVVMPKYKGVENARAELRRVLAGCAVPMPGWTSGCALDEATLPGSDVPVYLVEHNDYFWREHIYGPPGGAYPDNLERLSFLCRAALAVLEPLGWAPDVFHLNDWHTAPLAILVRQRGLPHATVFTAHNLGGGYQGVFPGEQAWVLGIDASQPWTTKFLSPSQVNLARAGLTCADMISTVSPTYAREVRDPAIGAGVDDLVRERGEDVWGILNGIDYDFWNPATDRFLDPADGYANFGPDDLSGKAACKAALQAEMGLPPRADVPLMAMVTRLDAQKGLDLVRAVLPDLSGVQLVILGTGAHEYENFFAQEAQVRSDVAVALKFDERLAHRIYAGADMFLMPSRFEPCGLGQMIALRYGTIPIVRATGGLADTVHEDGPHANGFVFTDYSALALRAALDRAIAAYRDKRLWARLVANAMACDFSWGASARRYLQLYEGALAKKHL
ncbi:MAG: glycogen synthase [Armatimonadetes bacterium]|nr:glycogen synthase [Armatimonadota bacterium]